MTEEWREDSRSLRSIAKSLSIIAAVAIDKSSRDIPDDMREELNDAVSLSWTKGEASKWMKEEQENE